MVTRLFNCQFLAPKNNIFAFIFGEFTSTELGLDQKALPLVSSQ
jgi:hypothetical protein